jgi:hypothetical protein
MLRFPIESGQVYQVRNRHNRRRLSFAVLRLRLGEYRLFVAGDDLVDTEPDPTLFNVIRVVDGGHFEVYDDGDYAGKVEFARDDRGGPWVGFDFPRDEWDVKLAFTSPRRDDVDLCGPHVAADFDESIDEHALEQGGEGQEGGGRPDPGLRSRVRRPKGNRPPKGQG